jgi:hypothetical protein
MFCRSAILESTFKADVLREALSVLKTIEAHTAVEQPPKPVVNAPAPASVPFPAPAPASVPAPAPAPAPAPTATPSVSPSRASATKAKRVSAKDATSTDAVWANDWGSFLEVAPTAIQQFATGTDSQQSPTRPGGSVVQSQPPAAPADPSASGVVLESDSPDDNEAPPKKQRVLSFERQPDAVQLQFDTSSERDTDSDVPEPVFVTPKQPGSRLYVPKVVTPSDSSQKRKPWTVEV